MHRSCKLRARRRGEACPGNASPEGDFAVRCFPGLPVPLGGFLPSTIWEVGRGKGLSKNISRKLVQKLRKIQETVIMQYLIMGQC